MNFSIREEKQEDYKQVCELFAEIDTLHCMALPDVFQEHNGFARSRRFFSDIISDENSTMFVAEQADRLIGLVHILIRESPAIPIMVPRRYAAIDALGVRQNFRRAGVGRALVESAHLWAINKGVTQIELSVWEFNDSAIAFYERLGYRTASRKMWRSIT